MIVFSVEVYESSCQLCNIPLYESADVLFSQEVIAHKAQLRKLLPTFTVSISTYNQFPWNLEHTLNRTASGHINMLLVSIYLVLIAKK